jgi:hypothetical protein
VMSRVKMMRRLERGVTPAAAVVAAATPRRIRVAARLTPNGMQHDGDLVVIPATALARDDEPRLEAVLPARDPTREPAREPRPVAVSASVVSFGTPERVESP